jgi:two-component system chemotaxis sensor kinase CheA
MDVVRRNIESLHGTVDVESVLGEGTTMRLTLPLTLATTQELLIEVCGQMFGIPIASVERIQRIGVADIATVEGTEAIVVDQEPISLVRLAAVLELTRNEKADTPKKLPMVILRAGRKRIAFLVDAVVAQQESVVKSLGKQLKRVRNVSGATILGTGQVIMALNPTDLINSARGASGGRQAVRRVVPETVQAPSRPSVMVVDDSITTRNLEKAILETAGYQVTVATDGAEALGMLQASPCDVVISDVLMPQMDGFELTTSIRSDPSLADTPVILVTSLESRQDRERGIEVGASAYIVKSTFDQENLLQAIEQLV